MLQPLHFPGGLTDEQAARMSGRGISTNRVFYDWYRSEESSLAAFMASLRVEAKLHYPGALTDVQVQIIQGHARRGQTFAALAAYNRYRHGHEV